MTRPYPLLFEPILKERVWGGDRLAAFGKNLPPNVRIGESWELADLPESAPGGRSVIANGPWAGRPLREIITGEPTALLGAASPSADGGFPLLIKFLDARENLSVQVHPDAAYVENHPEAWLKSEAWFVLERDPGAVIYKGVRPDITREQFAADIKTGRVVDDLISVPVKTGDCHYLPSGTCHALGAGIVVAEIQTPSDTTFRVFDWGRTEGRTDRETHVDQAIECIRFGDSDPVDRPLGPPVEAAGMRTTPLVKTDFFEVERIDAETDAMLPVITENMPVVWMMIEGSARIEYGADEPTRLPLGTTCLMPAALEGATSLIAKDSSFLRITLPSPTEGMIA